VTDRRYDALVIGAGVIGCSIAYALALDGFRVGVLDRGGAAGAGSTSASSAIIRFNYSTWEGVAISWESKYAWEQWENHLGGPDDAGMARYIKTGGLVLDSPGQDPGKVLALFDRAGVPYERWDAATIRARMRFLDPGRHYPPKALTDEAFWAEPDGELGGYWTPDSGFVDDPQLAAHNLMAAALRHGAEFRFHSAVSAVRRTADRVAGVALADGTRLEAPILVNAAGPHSGVINRLADVEADFAIRTRPMRQEVHQVRAPDGYNGGGIGPLISDLDLGTYFRGTPGDGLLIGGTEPECDPLQWLADPDEFNPNPTKAVYDAQTYRAAQRVPALALPDAPRGIAAVYDVADDWIPIYDKTALGGYYVAVGTSGNQFKNAPLVGHLLTALIRAAGEGQDHDTDPVHVTLPRTGHDLDLSHYSRKRHLNSDSSFSVMG
jgi:sarcosine oxidase subunit beta